MSRRSEATPEGVKPTSLGFWFALTLLQQMVVAGLTLVGGVGGYALCWRTLLPAGSDLSFWQAVALNAGIAELLCLAAMHLATATGLLLWRRWISVALALLLVWSSMLLIDLWWPNSGQLTAVNLAKTLWHQLGTGVALPLTVLLLRLPWMRRAYPSAGARQNVKRQSPETVPGFPAGPAGQVLGFWIFVAQLSLALLDAGISRYQMAGHLVPETLPMGGAAILFAGGARAGQALMLLLVLGMLAWWRNWSAIQVSLVLLWSWQGFVLAAWSIANWPDLLYLAGGPEDSLPNRGFGLLMLIGSGDRMAPFTFDFGALLIWTTYLTQSPQVHRLYPGHRRYSELLTDVAAF
jgi:hypothetical protein